jgi:predicted Zn-dependent protease
LQNSVVALLLVTITGDIASISSIGAALPTLMLQLKFSREFEAEADDFAIQYLKENNVSTEPLLGLLKSLDDSYDEDNPEVSNYFSSHPATIERIKKLRR